MVKRLSGMMTITMFIQLIAVYKSSLIVAHFGAGVELDAYNFANNLATFILTFVSAGTTTVVIPAYVKKLDKKALNTFLTVVFLVTILLLIIMYFLRGGIVEILTSREQVFKEYVCGVMLLTILIQVFPAILGVTTAYYQCIDKFNLPKIIMLFANLMVVVVLTIWKDFTLYEYLYVLLIGAIVQVIFDLAFAIRYGFRFSLSFDISNSEFRNMMKIFLPTLISTGIYKINVLIDSLLSSNLGDGQLTILSYSNLVVTMVNTLVVGNLIVYAYPKIVEKVQKNKRESQEELWKYIVDFHMVVCLLLAGFVCVGREFVGVLFEHGEFTSVAADTLYICMCIYMFDQQNNIVRDLIYRYFFAHGNTKSTVQNGIFTSIVNIIMSVILVRICGIYGIVIGTFIAGTFSLISITIRYKLNYEFLIDYKTNFMKILITLMVSIFSIFIVMFIKTRVPVVAEVASFILFGSLTVGVYVAGMYITRKILSTH